VSLVVVSYGNDIIKTSNGGENFLLNTKEKYLENDVTI
jgi:hypothetical protein